MIATAALLYGVCRATGDRGEPVSSRPPAYLAALLADLSGYAALVLAFGGVL